jgi:putative flippase GtrA
MCVPAMARHLDRAELVGSAARFIVSGGLFTALGYALFRLFLWLLGDVPAAPALAQVCTYSLCIPSAYMLNNWWTFQGSALTERKPIRFVATYLSALALSAVIIQLGVTVFHLTASVSWFMATALTTIMNFGLQRFWIFRPLRNAN